MSGAVPIKKPVSRAAILAASTALACLFGCGLATHSYAQSTDDLAASYKTNPNARLLLVADELVYDRDKDQVVAQGGVQIDYDGNKLVARTVTYDQKTGRLKATGNVEIIERDGNRIYADEIDITDDFSDGFVNALRVETIDNTRFAAESAERSGGNVTTFNQGVYTACEPCKENPEKAPVWQIKSRKIIWNGQKKTVRFEGASFELFGMPLATLPAFEIADPTVKRKTGFLIPGIEYKSELGVGLRVPFYVALAPNYDLLLSTTAYSKQGFLAEAEFRHRLNNGIYTLKTAGIYQQQPEEFDTGTHDRANKGRGMIGSEGNFQINPRWSFGWDVMAQTDGDFSRIYGIDGYDQLRRTNEIFLTGLSGRNYFDMHAYKFVVQASKVSSDATEQQPYVGVIDYSWTAPNPVVGGELNFDVHARGLKRDTRDNGGDKTGSREFGFKNTSGRFTAEGEWKRTIIVPGGLAFSPLLAVRGDSDFADVDDVSGLIRSEAMRAIATAGLDVRWPILFSTTSATHILEPIGQIFVRNNERFAGTLLNEDAQSLVFDTTSLFERDKFSGYDRMEGGTRANFGLRYSGTFANGWSASALVGQSYHLAGVNSFALPDLVEVGKESGLESDVSDVVAALGISNTRGFSLALRGRFDEKTLEMRRGETEVVYGDGKYSAALKYAYIQKQPTYGYNVDRHEISANAGIKFNENWRAFGSTTYDIKNDYFANHAVGFGYDDSCTALTLTYAESRSISGTTISEPKRSIGFNLSFRTLGDFGSKQSVEGL